MALFDTHCHLQAERIHQSLDSILDNAFQAAVSRMVCCGSTAEDWPEVRDIALRYPQVLPAFGLHPFYVDLAPNNWLTSLKEYLQHIPSLVGEIGLDLMLAKSSITNQLCAFESQLALAIELKRPVCIHCLNAWHYLLPILNTYQHPQVPIQIHSYSGGPKLVDQLLNLNCYFSFSCSLTRTKNHKAHQAIQIIPINRILIETDAPDIPPEQNGKVDFSIPNEPANLRLVLNKAASLLNMDTTLLETQLWQNTLTFLSLLVPSCPDSPECPV